MKVLKKAKKTKKRAKRSVKRVKPKKATLSDRYKQIKGDYRAGRLKGASAWTKLDYLEQRSKKLPKNMHANMYQMQADVLTKSGYPILASLYAAEAIKMHKDASSKELSRSWSLLQTISKQRPLQIVKEDLARVVSAKVNVPHYKRDWNYYRGNSELAKGEARKAVNYFSKLRLNDRYYLPAKYQKAMVFAELNKPKKAIAELNSILTVLRETKPNLNALELRRTADLTNLALGRLYYAEREFQKSIVHFRRVTREGEYFYDSLFEQSWAFFMAGYANHALGTLHGAESPFFAEVFNPEASMLKSITLYWMCRYEDSRNSLADFMDNHSETVEALGVFLDRQRLTPQTSYQLFENLVAGVSDQSLGIPRDILSSAAEQDHMMLLRDQYAHAVYEYDRISGIGISGNKTHLKFAKRKLKKYMKELQNNIGESYLVELKEMKKTFERLYDQAQFLYIELLMSEKEQILGRELHGDSKVADASSDRKVRGWGKKTVAWDADEKNEFWWDEIGYHIYDGKPQCNVK